MFCIGIAVAPLKFSMVHKKTLKPGHPLPFLGATVDGRSPAPPLDVYDPVKNGNKLPTLTGAPDFFHYTLED